MRPSIAVDGGAMRSEDDLTYKLGEIIKASANVRKSEQEGSPAHIITEFEQLLQVRLSASPLLSSLRTRTHSCSPTRVLTYVRSSTSRRTWTTTSPASRRRCKSPDDPSKPSARG